MAENSGSSAPPEPPFVAPTAGVGQMPAPQQATEDEPRTPRERTLADVMERAADAPPVVEISSTHGILDQPRRPEPRPERDLWISSVNDRFTCRIIPVYVGTGDTAKVFYVHKDHLARVKPFKAALSGAFKEAETQQITLPEEDPTVFHFLVAFLYEGTYTPIKTASTVLEPMGRRELAPEAPESNRQSPLLGNREVTVHIVPYVPPDTEPFDPAESSDDSGSDLGVVDAPLHRRRQRAADEGREAFSSKRPRLHRPGCECPGCRANAPARCLACGARDYGRRPSHAEYLRQRHRRDRLNRRAQNWAGPLPQPPPPPPPPPPPGAPANANTNPPGAPVAAGNAVGAAGSQQGDVQPPNSPRRFLDTTLGEETFRTWIHTFQLSLEVYMLAHRYLVGDFKATVSQYIVNMFESAGSNAARVEVFALIPKFYEHVGNSDPLALKILARLGFLHQIMIKGSQAELLRDFMTTNPELMYEIMKLSGERRSREPLSVYLPSMEGPNDEDRGLMPGGPRRGAGRGRQRDYDVADAFMRGYHPAPLAYPGDPPY